MIKIGHKIIACFKNTKKITAKVKKQKINEKILQKWQNRQKITGFQKNRAKLKKEEKFIKEQKINKIFFPK